jgi:hypothetical protein
MNIFYIRTYYNWKFVNKTFFYKGLFGSNMLISFFDSILIFQLFLILNPSINKKITFIIIFITYNILVNLYFLNYKRVVYMVRYVKSINVITRRIIWVSSFVIELVIIRLLLLVINS